MIKSLVVALLFAFAVQGASIEPLAAQDRERGGNDRDLPERDEFRQTYELAPGAQVELSSLNCSINIENAPGNTAEVHIVRSARTREALEYGKIDVEQTPNSLIIRGQRDRDGDWRGRGREVRQRVYLRIPRQVNLWAHGINGSVTGGEIDGTVRLNGINGVVRIDQATGYVDISGINGRVMMNIASVDERGVRVTGVNGGVELRFSDDLNADLEVSGCNGSVHADMPNVTVQGKIRRDNFRARIGEGGTPIVVNGVNGRVRLTRAGTAG
ncbi:MAG TPA: hypothetical protein VNO14_07595 [Blastocatellia bacterium]|nr:hypothetical protein [Blastocatellia bacterium]